MQLFFFICSKFKSRLKSTNFCHYMNENETLTPWTLASICHNVWITTEALQIIQRRHFTHLNVNMFSVKFIAYILLLLLLTTQVSRTKFVGYYILLSKNFMSWYVRRFRVRFYYLCCNENKLFGRKLNGSYRFSGKSKISNASTLASFFPISSGMRLRWIVKVEKGVI